METPVDDTALFGELNPGDNFFHESKFWLKIDSSTATPLKVPGVTTIGATQPVVPVTLKAVFA